jgi:hypothetical protein
MSNSLHNLAYRARIKLHKEASYPDRRLRFLVGHANFLDFLTDAIAISSNSSQSGGTESVKVFHSRCEGNSARQTLRREVSYYGPDGNADYYDPEYAGDLMKSFFQLSLLLEYESGKKETAELV